MAAAAACIINFCLSLAFLLIMTSTLTSTSDPLRLSLVNGRQPLRFSRHYDHQVRKMIGSRPPRCDRLCKSCRDCEAVQVPIHRQDEEEEEEGEENSRGDYIANYKPICWKCKCGDFIFNP